MNLEKLKKVLLGVGVKQNNVDLYTPILIKEWECIGLTDDEKQLWFLSNCLTETGYLTTLVENLNYSAQRLMAVFPSLFKTLDFAKQYEKNPEKLANYVYDSRVRKNTMGNNFDGAGWKYRGRGFFQTTWYGNYKILAEKTGIDCLNKPELLEIPEIAVKSASIYWKVGNLSNKPNLKEVRKSIAGSYFGYNDHILPNYLKLKSVYNKVL